MLPGPLWLTRWRIYSPGWNLQRVAHPERGTLVLAHSWGRWALRNIEGQDRPVSNGGSSDHRLWRRVRIWDSRKRLGDPRRERIKRLPTQNTQRHTVCRILLKKARSLSRMLVLPPQAFQLTPQDCQSKAESRGAQDWIGSSRAETGAIGYRRA